jgi:hypothetical protein
MDVVRNVIGMVLFQILSVAKSNNSAVLCLAWQSTESFLEPEKNARKTPPEGGVLLLVPEERLELSQGVTSADFESAASTVPPLRQRERKRIIAKEQAQKKQNLLISTPL